MDGVKGFIETSLLDWPGRVAGVVFVPGCNFRCPFCHNHQLVLRPDTFEDIPPEAVVSGLREHDGWIDGVVVTGGEPTVWPGLPALLRLFKDEGLPVKLDTNGYMPDVIKNIINQGLISAVAMDLKAPVEPGQYGRAAGVSADISRIRESIGTLLNSPVEVNFRATVVPGLHGLDDIREMAGGLCGRRLVLQNFRPADALDPGFRDIKPYSPEELRALQEAADAASEATQRRKA